MKDIYERYQNLSEIKNYKQISTDLETGKILLVDYNNKNFECNRFGIPIIKFYREITGQKSYSTRLKTNLIKKLKYPPPQYLPNTSNLVGSSKFPRPLSIPNFNQISNSNKLIDSLKRGEYFSFPKNKIVFELEKPMKDSKALPNFFCVKLGMDSPKTRKYLIKLLDEKIQNKKKEYYNEKKYYLKDSIYKGLNFYKNFFKENLTKNLFNGSKIEYTKQKDINDKFRIIQKLIKKDGLNKMHSERQNINQDIYNKLYRGLEHKNNNLKKNLSYINSLEIRRKNNDNLLIKDKDNYHDINVINNKIIKSNSLKIKPIKIKNSLSAIISPRDNEKTPIHNKYKSKRSKLFNSISNSMLNKNKYSLFQDNYNKSINNIINKEKGIYSPKIFHCFHRSLSDYDKDLIQKNDDKNYEDLNKEENINNMRYEEKIKIINREKILKLKEIKKIYEKEAILMKGYQPSEIKETSENIKLNGLKLVSPQEIYKKEIEIFKKVNQIAYEREMKMKLIDYNILKRKLQNKKILERIKILK